MTVDLFDVLEATWPPAGKATRDGLILREGLGGGKRVSAASVVDNDPTVLERQIDLPPLFQIRSDQPKIDTNLAKIAYQIVDPTSIYMRDLDADNVPAVPPVTSFAVWPPLQIMRDLWFDGGIDAARVAVMDRATGAKTGLLGRINKRAAGVAFVALHEGVAMVHALEVAPDFRRQGLARYLMHAAMLWSAENGASRFSLCVTERNKAACRLYTSLGMQAVDKYHYRIKLNESSDHV